MTPHIPPLLLSLLLVFSPPPTQSYDGTNLANGLFPTRINVDAQASLSLDIRDMTSYLTQSNFNLATNIYEGGANSQVFDDAGNVAVQKRTLQSLSLAASPTNEDAFRDEMTFAFHTFGLADGDPRRVNAYATYADDFVGNVLRDVTSGTLAAEAAVALNLWMYSVHELWECVNSCEMVGIVEENPNAGFGFDAKSVIESFDEAMAYYVGLDQRPGTSDGWALYALAQRAGEMFGRIEGGVGESFVNKEMGDLFERGHEFLSVDNPCGSEGRTEEERDLSLRNMWSIVNHMISQMTIPLVQMLIHAMKEEDADRVKLYALAVVPQIAACQTTSYRVLKESLLDRPYDADQFFTILTYLQQSYDCLGFTCEDVGSYKETEVAKCGDRPFNLPMAGYSPTSDVYQQAKIDLDIVQIRILSSMEKYSMASHIYNFGKNSFMEDLQYRTLQSFATTIDREKVKPTFSLFEEYHHQRDYADMIIQQMFNGDGKWNGDDVSVEQRTAVIVETIKSQVMYMYILTEMNDALSDCDGGDFSDNFNGAHAWDEVAAYIIGSLEGLATGGGDVDDGSLFWNMANARCGEFGTCNDESYSQINAEVETLLYAGKAELDALDCTNLYHTTTKLSRWLLIPIIQSVVHYALLIETLPIHNDLPFLPSGEAYALAVLPFVAPLNANKAGILQRNMIWGAGLRPMNDGAAVVADSFVELLDEYDIRCDRLGRSEDGVGFCGLSSAGGGRVGGGGGASLGRITSMVIAVTGVFIGLEYFFQNNTW